MRVLFTGASSFTGSYIVHALAKAGHSVVCTFSAANLHGYIGVRRARVEAVLRWCVPIWSTRWGTPSFLRLIEGGPWDALCHHAADTRGYTSPDFSWRNAFEENIKDAEQIFSSFRTNGGKHLLLTGSYFEAEEGAGSSPQINFSPYAISKSLTWHYLRDQALKVGLTVGKFVLPNPVGPYEEARLISYVATEWREGRIPNLSNPDYVRDNLPSIFIGLHYTDFLAQLVSSPEASVLRTNPSGWVESVASFVDRVSHEFSQRTPSTREFTFTQFRNNGSRQEPAERYNTGPNLLETSGPKLNRFWDQWFDYYFQPRCAPPLHECLES